MGAELEVEKIGASMETQILVADLIIKYTVL